MTIRRKNFLITQGVIGAWLGTMLFVSKWWHSWLAIAVMIAGYVALLIWTGRRWPVARIERNPRPDPQPGDVLIRRK